MYADAQSLMHYLKPKNFIFVGFWYFECIGGQMYVSNFYAYFEA